MSVYIHVSLSIFLKKPQTSIFPLLTSLPKVIAHANVMLINSSKSNAYSVSCTYTWIAVSFSVIKLPWNQLMKDLH